MGWQGGSDEQRFGGVEEATLKVFKKTSSPYLGLGRRVWQT
jgi:hypothetical protein